MVFAAIKRQLDDKKDFESLNPDVMTQCGVLRQKIASDKFVSFLYREYTMQPVETECDQSDVILFMKVWVPHMPPVTASEIFEFYFKRSKSITVLDPVFAKWFMTQTKLFSTQKSFSQAEARKEKSDLSKKVEAWKSLANEKKIIKNLDNRILAKLLQT